MTFEPFVPLVVPSDVDAISIAKTGLRGIIDSYHGDWDFIIELAQNAVDALDLKYKNNNKGIKDKPEIEIVINEKAGTIRVSDSGIGMTEEKAKKVLYPNYTDKPYFQKGSETRSLRGHKGVGLTFLAFGYNLIRYCSIKDNQLFSGEMTGGRIWLDSEDNSEPPKVKPSEYYTEFLEGRESGTSVEVFIGSDVFQKLSVNWLGWHYVIRCLTAVGYCDINEIFPWNKNATVKLKIINYNGDIVLPPEGFSENLPLLFYYPDKVLKSCNLDEYFTKYPEKTEPPKIEKGKYDALHIKWDTDKIEKNIFDKGEIEDKGSARYGYYVFTQKYIPSIYAMFTHSSRVWKDRLDQGYSTDKRRKFWRDGIQVVTQQMPTGQIQEVSLPFRAGNKDRFFMLIELPDAKPDYGRKGFKAEVNSYIQFVASELILNYFLSHRILLKPTATAHGKTAVDAEAVSDQRLFAVQEIPDLKIDKLNFKKEPQYENDVIALFCELAARDIIRGFEILSVSTGSQYDGVVNYRFKINPDKLLYHANNNPLGVTKAKLSNMDLLSKNLEFKKSLIDLIDDFDEGTKNAQQVRFVVAWDEGDITGTGYELINLLESDNYEHRTFHGETHQLVLENATIPVILLKYLLKFVF